MDTQMEPGALPLAMAPGVGVGHAVTPQSYLLRRERAGLSYQGLVDPVNERLTIKGARYGDAAALVTDVLRAARSHEMGKVLLYATEAQWKSLLANGFTLEAILDGFYQGDDAYLMGYMLHQERRACGDLAREQAVVEAALSAQVEPPPPLPEGYRVVSCGPEMAEALAAVYQAVFTSFPSPLQEPDFVTRLIRSGDGFFRAVMDGDRIASVAAAELERAYGAAEVTNCATLPAHRGEGLMQILIQEVERELQRLDFGCWFSVARSSSFGMNRALHKAGYQFRGRLRGNSHIMGGFEDMHLWVKRPRLH